jgi:hypothetical protein
MRALWFALAMTEQYVVYTAYVAKDMVRVARWEVSQWRK